jgi:cell division septation protein DedD
MASQDTEITLGTGKMLALFFGLVMLCAVFFGLGFSLGKNSGRPSLLADSGVPPSAPGIRPAASKTTPSSNAQGDGLTFYKAVEQKDPTPALNDAPAKASAGQEAATDDTSRSHSGAPDPMLTNAAISGYFVQVAAVSKQDDAQALVDALKKKQYSAFSANNGGSDKLYHVQIGPFTDIKDAEQTRSKLISDGYNPILKK